MRLAETTGLAILLAVVPLTVGCDKDWCKQKHDLVEASSIKGPPPGPIIDLEPVGNDLRWRISDANQGSSGSSIFDDDGNCDLRDDFVGSGVLIFQVFAQGSQTGINAEYVSIENTEYRVEIRKNSNNFIQWTVKEKTGGERYCVPLNGPVTPGVVPPELYDLADATITNEKDPSMNVERMKLRVKRVGP